jgi:hypothetical protein
MVNSTARTGGTRFDFKRNDCNYKVSRSRTLRNTGRSRDCNRVLFTPRVELRGHHGQSGLVVGLVSPIPIESVK